MKSAYLLPLFIASLFLIGCSGPVAQRGDTVMVFYTGQYLNGTIFDTNDPANADIFPAAPERFTPLPVTIGKGQVIPGFENALLGLKEGQTVSVIVKPKDGYGTWDPSRRFSVPKATSLPSHLEISREVVRNKAEVLSVLKNPADLQVGKLLPTTNLIYNITAINETHVTMLLLQAANPAEFEGVPWKSVIESESANTVSYRHAVMTGDTFTTANGPYEAIVNATHVILKSTLEMGDSFQYGGRQGRVVTETPTSFTVDGNHPLAGYDMNFTITIDTLIPKK